MLKLQKSVQITLIISMAVILLTVIIFSFINSASSENTIRVNGQGLEKVTPDRISIYFNIETKGSTSKIAEDANSNITIKLKNYLMALGFADEDLKTENYNIYPDYDYSTRKTSGFRAIHSLKIEFSADETEKVSGVIDAGTNAGAGISYINFELSPKLEQRYKTAAIKTASEDAKLKAEAIAEGFEKNLGRLVSISLDEFNYYPWNVYSAKTEGDVDSSGTISSEESNAQARTATAGMTPSEREVTAYVTAVYKVN